MPLRKLQELLTAEVLDVGELESFALHNPWNPDDKNDLDKLSGQLQSIPEPNKLQVLQVLQPAFEPGRFILDHFDYLTSILLNPSNLENGETATKLLADTFRTYVPPDSEYQTTLALAARKILDTYVSETQGRWDTFEQIVAGKSVFEYNIPLDPNRIPKLEYVAFQYGMSNPLSFYNLLNQLAVEVETRLHAFMLLKLFLIVEDTPTYYLIDADLFGTVISSTVNDTDICIFQTALTIITIFLPIVAVKSVSKLDELLSVLITAIRWEVWYPEMLRHASPRKEHSAEHGKYACLSDYLNDRYVPPPNTASFKVAPDSLQKYVDIAHKAAQWDEKVYITKRIENLIQSHKCHLNAIVSTVEKERKEPWFLKNEASDIIISCFQLYVKEYDSNIELITEEFETLEQVSASIMRINTFLHGPIIPSDLELRLKNSLIELEATTLKSRELREELDRLQKKQAYFESESNTQLENLKTEVELKAVQINSLNNKCEALKVEISELKHLNDSLQSYNPGLLTNLQAHNEQLKKEIESLKNQQVQREEKVEDRKEQDAQMYILQKRVQDCNFEIDLLKNKIDELSQTERDYINLKQEYSKCATELEQKCKSNEEMSLLFAEELKAQESRYETVKKIMLQYQCKIMSIQNPQQEKQ
ncbi:hypothetical protein HK103_000221 [Boothiomyces macroporosus]|uniref:Uncharacterized protein n=1 Tax=Boothiomyces macroporosus TaxID=261099 RepID=A0AAD5YA83_9FUNG|nr:hypothetical protein HK103_000221 [Boothiomyces macroporosus]